MDRTVPESLANTVEQPESLEALAPKRRWPARLLLGALLAAACVSLVNHGVTIFIRHSWLRESIHRHLTSAFGRPVEVGNYSFTIWSGPQVTADEVSVAEDPRFGNEYFLRAESLSVRLRWSGLLRGHLVLGRVLLTRPSLNLVRNQAGDWNFSEWMPRPANAHLVSGFAAPAHADLPGFVLNRIEVEEGRVNFKLENEKLPLALVNVSGYVEPENAARWRLDMEAEPLRAPVMLQQPGILHVTGEVGGTSSRLRPANLQFFWAQASVSDVVRLALEKDAGVRGLLNLEVDASTKQDTWDMKLHANLSGLHRWDLAARTDNPSLAISATVTVDPAKSFAQIAGGTIEAPHSHLNFMNVVEWSQNAGKQTPPPEHSRATITASEISMADILSWIRAFRPDVAPDISLSGTVNARMDSHGWPPQIDRAFVGWRDTSLTGPRLRAPIRLSTGALESDAGRWTLSPVNLSFGDAGGSLRLVATGRSAARGSARALQDSQWEISGQVTHVRDLISGAGAFGWNLSRGWDLEGPLRCDLRWPTSELPWRGEPVGTVDWGVATEGASLQTPFLNQPILGIRAHAEWKPASRSIALSGAEAFGAHWSGSFERRDALPEWQFDLSADHLAAADLDRWLDPRWKQGLLERLLPFLNPRSPANAMPENLAARGTIGVGQLTLATTVLHKLEGNLSLRGRTIELTGARAQMFGGTVSGAFLADLHAAPGYSATVKFARVDLGAWSEAAAPSLNEPRAVDFSGLATGETTIHAQGADRASLAASLTCQGSWEIQGPEIHGIDLGESLTTGSLTPGTSAFRDASGKFSCGNGRIHISLLKLAGANQEYDVSGSIDFARLADLRVRAVSLSSAPRIASESDEAGSGAAETYSLTGNLSSLELRAAPHPAPIK